MYLPFTVRIIKASIADVVVEGYSFDAADGLQEHRRAAIESVCWRVSLFAATYPVHTNFARTQLAYSTGERIHCVMKRCEFKELNQSS